MTQRFVSSLLILATLFFGIPVMPVSADPAGAMTAPVGMMTYVEGRVDRNTGDDYFPSIKEEPILPGDTIRTKTYSRAEIVFNDKSVLRIGENTQVKIKDYTLKNGKREKASLFVDRGKVRVMVSKSHTGATNFDILTPNSEGSVKGSDICVSYLKSSTSILALEGEIAAKSLDFPDKEIRVTGGQTAYVPFGAPPFGPRPFLKVEQKRFEAETSPAVKTPDQSQIRKAIVAKFIGSVRIRNSESEPWHMPGVKEAIGAGAEIETGTDGKVQIVLESGRVINLKPNTHLKISRLSRDPKTGTLEDILESKLGEIRAKIDKKKEGSRFEIHSPIAIAAVKGTNLYFFVKPKSSTSFFEFGNGTLTNLIKKAAIDIAAGKNGAVDSEGNTYGPSNTSREVLDEISQGWEIDDETYGYTPPPGPDYIPPYEPQNPETGLEDGGDSNPFEDIKPEILGQPSEQVLEELGLNVFGIWGADPNQGSLYSNEEGGTLQWRGEDFGYIAAQVFPWVSTQPFLIVGGIFSDTSEGSRPLLFNSIISSEVPGSDTGQATSDGGAFWGYTAGIWSGVEGTLVAFFVDPNGNIGVLTGNSSGVFDNETGTWSASGNLTPTVLGHDEGIDPQSFRSNVLSISFDTASFGGNFAGQGDIDAYVYRTNFSFLRDTSNDLMPSHDFGIFNLRLVNGIFSQSAGGGTVWNAVVGGNDGFGLYHPEGIQFSIVDTGYWLAQMGGSWENGEIRGNILGAFLTQTHLGVLDGVASGIFNDYEGVGDFNLQAVGAYQSQPLSFFNTIETTLYDANGSFEGFLNAYMGGLDSVLIDGGVADVFVLGELDSGNTYYGLNNGHYIFSTSVTSYNALLDVAGAPEANTTFDGGTYFGYIAGAQNFNNVNAGFAGIYVGPAGEGGSAAGLITGPLNGEFFGDVNLFSAEGKLTTRQLDNVEVLPENAVENHIYYTGGEGELLGGFDGVETNGSIHGYDNFYTASLVNAQAYIPYAATWGIYYQQFGDGSFINPEGSSTWSGFMGGYDPIGAFYSEVLTDDYGYWLADITDGAWADENFTAHLAGKFLTNTKLGTLEGDIFGLYSESSGEGYWNGVGVGSWEGAPLDFAARIINSEGMDFARFNGEDFNTFGSLSESLIGGVGNLFETPNLLLMGNYSTEGNNQLPILWGVDIQSYSIFDINPVTFEGDGFYGFAGGRWANGEINGGTRLLYIRNDGGYYESSNSAGIISGDLNGRYFEFDSESASGMWYAEGDLSSQELGSTWISPEELNNVEYGAIEERIFSGSGISLAIPGDLLVFTGAGANFINISGEDWGIWAGAFAGGYLFNSEVPLENEAFRTAFGGVAPSEYENGYPLYIFGTMDGSFTDVNGDTGNVDAVVNGIWISAQGTQQNEFVKVGTVTGDVFGDFDSNGNWEAAGIGEWNKVTELDPNQINFDQIQSVLSDLAVGEVLNSNLAGSGSFNEGAGSITGNMDLSLFSSRSLDFGIWSALFNGSFTGLPGQVDSWAATFTGTGVEGDVTAQLNGIQWQDGQWLANVSGTVGPSVDFSGQAGGTYTVNQNDPSSGNFSGVGVGTWSNNEGCQECA